MHFCLTCFNSQADTPIQYQVHCLMKGVQGFTWSHWKPSLVKYSCRIPPASNMVTCRIKRQKKHHTCRPFFWPWWFAGTIPSTSPGGGGPGLWQKPLINASRPVLKAIVAFETKISAFFEHFHCPPTFQQVKVTSRLPNNNRI